MRINHNIGAINTNRQLGVANANQSKSMEKLSSGLRINRAGDDAAGLAISEKMRAQVRGLDRASSNAQDGISMIQTAEGALNETHSILQRMRELAVQAGNDTNTSADRGEIQKEINQLTSEINRIGNTTEFNTQKLLDGSKSTGGLSTVAAGEGPKSAVAGVFKLKLSDSYNAGESITIDGVKLTAVKSGEATSATQFNASSTISGQAKALSQAIANNKDLSDKYLATISNDTITLTQKTPTDAADLPVTDSRAGVVTEAFTSKVGVTSEKATYNIKLSDIRSGETFKISGGVELTAVSGAITNSGQFSVTGDARADLEALVKAIKASGLTGTKFSGYTVEVNDTRDGIKLTAPNEGYVSGGTIPSSIVKGTTDGVITQLKTGASGVKGEYNVTVSDGFKAGDTITVDGVKLTAIASGSTAKAGEFNIKGTASGQAAALKKALSGSSLSGSYTFTVSDNKITLTQKTAKSDLSISVSDSSNGTSSIKASTQTVGVAKSDGNAGVYEFKAGTDAIKIGDVTFAYGSDIGAGQWDTDAKLAGLINNSSLKDSYTAEAVDGKIRLTQKEGNFSSAPLTVTGNDNSATLQIGANEGQAMEISIGDMRAAALGITGRGTGFTKEEGVNNGTDAAGIESALDVSTSKNAASAVTKIQAAIDKVSAERSKLGANQNRLDHTINNLSTSSENLTAAESRIRDVDMAKEMMEQTKQSILAQASQAMLAQANQKPQAVLQLLG